ncbi:hypothetical protein BST81_09635 [Leptolyngbya sp. 'hensonii']|uniref:hypothetical protein n=1 Tax=Leptolyngbya sp. 'hensonii' TaxID=1922337 RepID=UPI00094F51D1|nr:hypothetical protein [Leptolyngbya sp. 'hensonii']OLP18550.1 hypothetical protein BST81_09635 [Leptolyngbya sp. 'hensonii']
MNQAVESGYLLTEMNLPHEASITSLAELWAKKYVQNLQVEGTDSSAPLLGLAEVASQEGRIATVERLRQSLRFASAQAWSKTEGLLAKEVQRHHISPDLIDPWQIAEDSRYLFEKALAVYSEQNHARQISLLNTLVEQSPYASQANLGKAITDLPTPGRLSVVIGSEVGQIRRQYTAQDPRVLGFVSMQFHYSGQALLELLSPLEQALVGSYFKVIDDNLYMPLQRSYEAAATQDYDSPALAAVRQLLPISTEIAKALVQRVAEIYSGYSCHSGQLNSPMIKISSIRDVEMFQVYLCLCVLEGSITSIQEELFPLCVMLYPPLKVRWEMIRHMLRLLGQEIGDRLGEPYVTQFRPYLRSLWEMFSAEVLPD